MEIIRRVKGETVTENEKNPNEPRQLSDEELADVNGGGFRLGITWNYSMEQDIQLGHAESSNRGKTMDDYLRSMGVGDDQLAARDAWLKAGSPRDKGYAAIRSSDGGLTCKPCPLF